jgi:hypothetical protein
MWRIAAALCGALLVIGAAAAAPIVPVPVKTRAEAVTQLRAAIEDELRVIELIKKKPPRVETARDRIDKSVARLLGVGDYLSGVPGGKAAEDAVNGARSDDWTAYTLISAPGGPSALGQRRAIEYLERALLRKRGALRVMPDAQPPAAAQCSDGKDNDGDGIVDWTVEPGCTSARDVRESSRFTCTVRSSAVAGRLALEGSCSGTFSEVEFTLLDGLQLNGRFDIKHAPSCSPPTVTRVRCKTKNGAQNPGRLVDARFTATARQPGQRVQLRFFDVRKRQIARFVVPVR